MTNGKTERRMISINAEIQGDRVLTLHLRGSDIKLVCADTRDGAAEENQDEDVPVEECVGADEEDSCTQQNLA